MASGLKIDGPLDKHKAHFIACGFSQRKSIDYTKMFILEAKNGRPQNYTFDHLQLLLGLNLT